MPDPVDRPLTRRERDVLNAFLAVDFLGVERLRREAEAIRVVGVCGCGCPSIDFQRAVGVGMKIEVNAAVDGSDDGLFLFTVAGRLGGIEYVGVSGERDPAEFPGPALLRLWAA